MPRPTPGIDTLEREEYVAAAARLRRKIQRYRPPVVALIGVTVFRALFPERKGAVTLGLQKEAHWRVGGVRAAEPERKERELLVPGDAARLPGAGSLQSNRSTVIGV